MPPRSILLRVAAILLALASQACRHGSSGRDGGAAGDAATDAAASEHATDAGQGPDGPAGAADAVDGASVDASPDATEDTAAGGDRSNDGATGADAHDGATGGDAYDGAPSGDGPIDGAGDGGDAPTDAQAPKLFQLSGLYDHGTTYVADVTGDGKVDLIFLEENLVDPAFRWKDIAVWKGNGNGTFATTPVTTPLNWTDDSFAAGDVTGDGRWDLVLTKVIYADANPDPPLRLTMAQGQADGSFKIVPAGQLLPGPSLFVTCAAMADVAGDGVPDVIVLRRDAQGAISVLLAGGGTGEKTTTLSAGDAGSLSCTAVGDVDGDGHPDLGLNLLPRTGLVDGPPRAVVVFGNGDGSFGNPVTVGTDVVSIARFGDADGDGRADVLLRTAASKYQILWSGSTRGTFTLGPPQQFLSVGDFDGDRKVDLLSTVPNTTFFFGDGARGFGRPLQVPRILPGLVTVDLDGDGATDVIDPSNAVTSVYLSTAKHALLVPADLHCADANVCNSLTSF